MDKFFKISERGSSVKTEVVGGVSTFLAMCYIVIVNPMILAASGMPMEAVFTATILTSIVGCLIAAFYANLPVGLMPGMGMNAFFTYTVVLTMGYTWEEALFALFISSIFFFLISVTGVRKRVIGAIPPVLRSAISSGIGFFIAFIGLQSIGLIVASESTLVTLGDFTNPVTFLGVIGILITLILVVRKAPAAIFIGMMVGMVLGVVAQVIFGADLGLVMPESIVSMPPSIAPTFMKAFTETDIAALLTDPSFWFIVISILFVDFFDTTGSIISFGDELGLIDENNELVGAERIMIADSIAITSASVFGTSSVAPVVESMVGISLGARTGLCALVIAFCFFLTLFLSPLLMLVGPWVTAPALVCVGIFMVSHQSKIDYSNFVNAACAFVTMLMMILTYSISEGIAMGFIVYTVLTIASGDYKKLSPLMYVLTIFFTIHYIV